MAQSSTPSTLERLGVPIPKSKPDTVPTTARVAIGYLFQDLEKKRYLAPEDEILLDLQRVGRLTSKELGDQPQKGFVNRFNHRFSLLKWYQVLSFLERTYSRHLRSVYIYMARRQLHLKKLGITSQLN
jgi:hypothetical protein